MVIEDQPHTVAYYMIKDWADRNVDPDDELKINFIMQVSDVVGNYLAVVMDDVLGNNPNQSPSYQKLIKQVYWLMVEAPEVFQIVPERCSSDQEVYRVIQ